MSTPGTRTITVPPVLRSSPFWEAFPDLATKEKLPLPLTDDLLVQIRAIEHSSYCGIPSSAAQQAAATNLLCQALAENTPSQPGWVQELLDGQRTHYAQQQRFDQQLSDLKSDVGELKSDLREIKERQRQRDIVAQNLVLDSIRLPLLPVPLLSSMPALPANFRSSSLDAILDSTHADTIDEALRSYGLELPTGLSKSKKARALFKFFGGVERLEVAAN